MAAGYIWKRRLELNNTDKPNQACRVGELSTPLRKKKNIYIYSTYKYL
jgi:hypothetical protein